MEPTTPRSNTRRRKILIARRFRRRVCRTRRDAKGDVRMMRCMWCCGRLGEDLSAHVVCMYGAVAVYAWRVQCMHVRVRKFIVNKISNGPGDDFLRAPIQIMKPSNIKSLSSNANVTTARIYAPRKSSAARLTASGRVPYRQN